MKPGKFYLIHTRANGFEKLFTLTENYRYFFNKYLLYSRSICKTYAYCFMPDRVQLLIRINKKKDLERLWRSRLAGKRGIKKEKALDLLINRHFGNLLNSYASSFNKMFKRKGSLFTRPFRRQMVSAPELKTIVAYIHTDAATLSPEILADWNWSSFRKILFNENTAVEKNEVIRWFGSLAEFESFHHDFLAISKNNARNCSLTRANSS